MTDATNGNNSTAQLADEYVLGLLDRDEDARVEEALLHDPVLIRAVSASQERFLPLDAAVAPVAVDESLWARIAAALPAQTLHTRQKPRSAANDNVSAGWRTLALSAMAAMVMMAAGLGWFATRINEPVVVAVLLNDAGDVQAIIEDYGDRNARVKMLGAAHVPPGKAIQAWTLPSPVAGPTSLGLLEGSSSARLKSAGLPEPKTGQLYELTLEPAGGSPTGRPTGPILAKGFAKTLL